MKQKEQNASFISVGRLRVSDWSLGPQAHTHWEMIFVLSGMIGVRMNGQELSGQAGDVLVYPAGVMHTEWCASTTPLETLFIAFHWPSGPAEPPLLFVDARGRLRVMAEWLHAEREARGRSTSDIHAALLQSILTECCALWEHRDPELVERMRRYVEEHLTDPIALEDVSRALGLSRYHLIRKYRALTGHTPMADVTRIRLERARDLILTTAMPMKEIAPRVGLTDVYRMGRLFRKHLDMTPGSLRRRP